LKIEKQTGEKDSAELNCRNVAKTVYINILLKFKIRINYIKRIKQWKIKNKYF